MKIPDYERGYFSPRRRDREILKLASDLAVQSAIAAEKASIAAGRKLQDVYDIYDSPLETPSGRLMGPYSFTYDFQPFASPEQTFREYIESTVPEHAVGVEIGGPGRALFRGFTPGTFETTIAMTLADPRTPEQKEEDEALGHSIIEGDFRENWDELKERLDGRKVHVLFARMQGGDAALPQDPYHLSQQLNKAYSFVDENRGKILAGVPKIMEPIVRPWVREIITYHSDVLGVELSPGALKSNIEIEKLPGAPEELPMLSARDIRRHYEKHMEGQPKYLTQEEMVRRQEERDRVYAEEEKAVNKLLQEAGEPPVPPMGVIPVEEKYLTPEPESAETLFERYGIENAPLQESQQVGQPPLEIEE